MKISDKGDYTLKAVDSVTSPASCNEPRNSKNKTPVLCIKYRRVEIKGENHGRAELRF